MPRDAAAADLHERLLRLHQRCLFPGHNRTQYYSQWYTVQTDGIRLSAAEDQIGIGRNHRRQRFLSNPIKRAYPLKPLCTPLNMVQAWFGSVIFLQIILF